VFFGFSAIDFKAIFQKVLSNPMVYTWNFSAVIFSAIQLSFSSSPLVSSLFTYVQSRHKSYLLKIINIEKVSAISLLVDG